MVIKLNVWPLTCYHSHWQNLISLTTDNIEFDHLRSVLAKCPFRPNCSVQSIHFQFNIWNIQVVIISLKEVKDTERSVTHTSACILNLLNRVN